MHFIAKNTIEENMLGLLSFKQSMFDGVLDGGQSDVFLDGTRLEKFMASVEKATTIQTIPTQSTGNTPSDNQQPSTTNTIASTETNNTQTPDATTTKPNPLGDLLTAGAAFLNELGKSLQTSPTETETEKPGKSSTLSQIIDVDKSTGKSYLKLPIPQGEEAKGLSNLLQAVIKHLNLTP